jgi:very-short-patch-repair endonuclease
LESVKINTNNKSKPLIIMQSQITTQQDNFESIKHFENGVEFWLARELRPLLGYAKWETFSNVIEKAKIACEHSGNSVELCFPDAGKTSKMPNGGEKPVEDYMLTRYACYLIAQNGDPKKREIALAQTYFAVQTRKQEINENSPLEGWQSETDGVFGISTKDKFNKYQSLPFNSKLKNKARELRKAGILSEVLFWNCVKNRQILDLDFERQKIIGNYIVDFFCPVLGLVIEIDGESHDFKGEYDAEREKYLIGLGLEVLHFTDIDIKKGLDVVMGNLYNYFESKKHPVSFAATPQEGNSTKVHKV